MPSNSHGRETEIDCPSLLHTSPTDSHCKAGLTLLCRPSLLSKETIIPHTLLASKGCRRAASKSINLPISRVFRSQNILIGARSRLIFFFSLNAKANGFSFWKAYKMKACSWPFEKKKRSFLDSSDPGINPTLEFLKNVQSSPQRSFTFRDKKKKGRCYCTEMALHTKKLAGLKLSSSGHTGPTCWWSWDNPTIYWV